jgi:creatinine amidohydrolase
MNKEVDLSVSCYGVARKRKYDVAVLPWGATEPHNLHLPYLTDCILSHAVCVDAAELTLGQSGVRCMVMPPVPYGSQNPGQRELPFCIHARYDTQRAILCDTVASLYSQGIRRMVIVSGHGGNNFKNMIRDLSLDYPDFLIATTEWFAIVPCEGYFEVCGNHADELETSVMMHYHPELVNLSEAGEGKSKPFAVQSLNNNIAWVPRNWQKVTEDTGIGDPRKATAEKGKRYAKAVVEKLSLLFTELAGDTIYF